jgi:hypothetical protein
VEHHFVVAYDTRTGRFFVDDETASAVMPDGVVYDPDSGEWRLDDYEDGYAETAAVLADLLKQPGSYELREGKNR